MTKRELNRDIKKLWKMFESRHVNQTLESEIKAEWIRLYNADKEAEWMTVESLKAILRINGCFRFRTLHWIDINFEPFKK